MRSFNEVGSRADELIQCHIINGLIAEGESRSKAQPAQYTMEAMV